MCGFLGEITNNLLEPNAFKSLLDLGKQRGPDQQGFWKDATCQFGFNRLAILDISEAGKQPMISPSGRFVMVLNGEVYNYKELQKQYQINKEQLRSTSDAEIIVHLLDKEPIHKIASILNGMFAIAVWDIQTQKQYLIRDFSGIKPLYYGVKDGELVFASQFDQIFKHPSFKEKELRADAMKSFFGFGYMHAPDTVFKNIFQVEPGHLVVWDYKVKSLIENTTYYQWQVEEKLKDTDINTKTAFNTCMQKVVKLQLQSDVPLGTFLSSGYDSSLITAFAKQEEPLIRAFTFGIDSHGKFDERDDASNYAAHLKVNHTTDTAKEADLLDVIDSHFKAIPEPFGDYSSIPTYVICDKASQFAKVMLSGDGGDELFWGYPRFRTSLKNAYWFNYPLWCRKIIMPVIRKMKKKVPWGIQMYRHFSDWILNKQVHFSDIDSFMPNVSFPLSIYETYNYTGSLKKPQILQYLKKNEFYGHLQRVLKKVDLTSMAHSLEVRVPFLDKEMIAFSNQIESGFTINHNRTKLILKTSLYDFIPKEMVNTEKKGFSVPMASWLRNELKSDFKETLLERPFYGSEHVNMEYLKKIISAFFEGDNSVDFWGLWHVYAWQKWAIHNDLV